jgi:P pilus assembly chaperone PapD
MKKRFLSAALGVALLSGMHAEAGVLVGATRVVFDGKKREASLSVKNEEKIPFVVQTWLDNGDDQRKDGTPFVVTPPIFRLDPGKENILRVMYSGQGAPTDRESVYWLNVQEIPPAPEQENVLQIAVRSRVKLFYRPKGLGGDPVQAAEQLQWHINPDSKTGKVKLVARNDSAYHVNLAEIKLKSHGAEQDVAIGMVPPKGEKTFDVKQPAGVSPGTEVQYSFINDYGGVSEPLKTSVTAAGQ